MSLSRQETRRTGEELRRNLELSGLASTDVQVDLGFTPDRLAVALDVSGADPVDVWMLRDYLEHSVIDSGRTPHPFTVLTEESRRDALMWFTLREAPRHDFAPSATPRD